MGKQWKNLREYIYIAGEGWSIHFIVQTKKKHFRRVYRMVIKIYHNGKEVMDDTQKISMLMALTMSRAPPYSWVKFGEEYWNRWKNKNNDRYVVEVGVEGC